MVLGIEARGFIFAPALAYALGAGFVPVRKHKKLPAECVSVSYDLEYGTDSSGDAQGRHRAAASRVLIVDDLLATGGTAAAAARMVAERRRQRGRPGIRGRADFPRTVGRSWRATTCSRCCSTTNEQACRRGPARRVRALAKINLDLRVLAKRPDGYHELRTIFQTISLADTLDIAFTPGRKTAIELDDPLGIPDNLAVQAARTGAGGHGHDRARRDAAGEAHPHGRRLGRRIVGCRRGAAGAAGARRPACRDAAVCIALAAASRQRCALLPAGRHGGGNRARHRTVSAARSRPAERALLVAPGVHVSTAEAYRRLSPRLTSESQQNKIVSFQSHVVGWECRRGRSQRF